MKNNVYVMSDQLTGRYGATFDSATDESAKVHVLRLYGNSQDYDNLHFFRTGSIDIETGKMECLDTIVEIKKLSRPEELKTPPIDEIERNV